MDFKCPHRKCVKERSGEREGCNSKTVCRHIFLILVWGTPELCLNVLDTNSFFTAGGNYSTIFIGVYHLNLCLVYNFVSFLYILYIRISIIIIYKFIILSHSYIYYK
jgi:hypothetical protein